MLRQHLFHLRYLFHKAFSSLPIPDPHSGYEGELLERGVKPYGFISERVLYTPSHYAVLDKRDFNDIQQRAIADFAVASGRLLKHELRIPAAESQFNQEMIVHHYCQPQFLNDMMEKVREMEAYWRGAPDVHLSREFGYYIGCTDTDFTLAEKSKVAQSILWHISPLTRYCRAQALKHEGIIGTLPALRTRP